MSFHGHLATCEFSLKLNHIGKYNCAQGGWAGPQHYPIRLQVCDSPVAISIWSSECLRILESAGSFPLFIHPLNVHDRRRSRSFSLPKTPIDIYKNSVKKKLAFYVLQV